MNFHWQGMGRAGGRGCWGGGGQIQFLVWELRCHMLVQHGQNHIKKSGAEWGEGRPTSRIISADVEWPKILTHRWWKCKTISLESSWAFSLKAICYHMSPRYLPKRNGSACPRKILNKECSWPLHSHCLKTGNNLNVYQEINEQTN